MSSIVRPLKETQHPTKGVSLLIGRDALFLLLPFAGGRITASPRLDGKARSSSLSIVRVAGRRHSGQPEQNRCPLAGPHHFVPAERVRYSLPARRLAGVAGRRGDRLNLLPPTLFFLSGSSDLPDGRQAFGETTTTRRKQR